MEKEFQPKSGYLMLLVFIFSIAAVVTVTAVTENPLYVIGFILIPLIAPGFIVINPNESAVLVLFGKYIGTIRINGFFWTNPFYIKKRISLRARNFNGEPIKVNP